MVEGAGGESLATVVIAGAANLGVALAKLVAGLLSGSAAMLSEAAHSAADTVNEVLLVVALRRAGRPADPSHPFGHGKAGFFWALMAAGVTLAGGAGFSITHGVQTIVEGEELSDLRVAYAVLAVSFVLESLSFSRAISQTRREAGRRGTGLAGYVRNTSDTALKAVLFEDTAALAGLAIATVGLAGYQVTGSPVWDGAASVLIGLLLLGVALSLIQTNASLLIGQAAPVPMRREIEAEMLAQPEVVGVVELLTMMLGPNQVLVAAKVDFDDTATAAGVELAADRVERRLVERFPGISQVFLDPTPGLSRRERG